MPIVATGCMSFGCSFCKKKTRCVAFDTRALRSNLGLNETQEPLG